MDSSQALESCVEHKLHTVDQRILQRGQWIRAAILGANDGLLSTTSLMLGVGAAKEDRQSMVVSGLAGALAGAFSMAVGEYVSVSTQRDIERATTPPKFTSNIQIPDQQQHVIKLNTNTAATPTSINETKQGETVLAMPNDSLTPSTNILMIPAESKLVQIFSPGRSPMMKVIKEAKTANDEEKQLPNPFKAAVASAMAFLCGSGVPIVPALVFSENIIRIVVMGIVTTIALAVFGGLGAGLGGSPVRISAARVVAGGWIAMGITYALLKPFDRR